MDNRSNQRSTPRQPRKTAATAAFTDRLPGYALPPVRKGYKADNSCATKPDNSICCQQDGLRSCPDLKQIFPDMTGAKTFFPRASAVKTLPAAHAAPCISMPENYSQLHLTSRRKKWFIEKINISSSRNTVQIRGDPIAVIGDAGLHRDFPGHSQIVLWGEGRRPADDPKARRPDAHVFYGRCCRASGYSHGNRTRSDSPMELLRVFL